MVKDELSAIIDGLGAEFAGLADGIWDHPEICYEENYAVAAQARMLEAHGFRVTVGIAGIPTALLAEAGSGGPTVAFLGEYDALPNLSQEAGATVEKPTTPGGHGHGCGHNLLGTASMLSAVALAKHLEANKISGTVRYYGCPAEEGGAAKVFMVRAGAFEGVDAAVSWHPGPFVGLFEPTSLANMRIDFKFVGRAAHAAVAPHLGRSALDAVELMNVGVNYLREHVPPDSRIHYAVLDSGGIAANVVKAFAHVQYLVRSSSLDGMMALAKRVQKVAEGAALMTETQMSFEVTSAVSNLIRNKPLEIAMQAHLDRLGAPAFDDAEREFARKFQATLTPGAIEAAYRRFGLDPLDGEALCSRVVPRDAEIEPLMGSTDVGDVSWVVPTIQARGATHAIGTPGHSWQLVAQGKATAAHKGMIHVAKTMSATALDILTNEALLADAKADHAKRTSAGYRCPIPDQVQPQLPSAA